MIMFSFTERKMFNLKKHIYKVENQAVQEILKKMILCYVWTETWSDKLTDMSYSGFNLYSLHRNNKRPFMRNTGDINCHVHN